MPIMRTMNADRQSVSTIAMNLCYVHVLCECYGLCECTFTLPTQHYCVTDYEWLSTLIGSELKKFTQQSQPAFKLKKKK